MEHSYICQKIKNQRSEVRLNKSDIRYPIIDYYKTIEKEGFGGSSQFLQVLFIWFTVLLINGTLIEIYDLRLRIKILTQEIISPHQHH